MTEHDITDQLSESMTLSADRLAVFRDDYTLSLTPEGVFVVRQALETRADHTETDAAADVASALLSEFRQETVATNEATLTGAEWYHIYGAVYTLAFSYQEAVSREQLSETADCIREGLPEEIQDIMDKVAENMESTLRTLDNA